MNKHTIAVLEFQKIINTIARFSFTSWMGAEIGKELEEKFILNQESAAAIIRKSLSLRSLIAHKEFVGFSFVEDFSPVIEQLGVEGSVLDFEEFQVLFPAINLSIQLLAYKDQNFLIDTLSFPTEKAHQIVEIFRENPDFRELKRSLIRFFDDSGRLKEDQIPELLTIKRRIQNLNQELFHTAKSLLTKDSNSYSSDTPVFREGRVMLPMRSDFRGKNQGIVHGTSDSGQTLYVEPQIVLEQNNALIQAKAAYSQELQKILRICTNSLRDYLREVTALFSHFSRLDELVMRARWAIEYDCSEPVISSDQLELRRVRHPLLGKKAVPLDIRFHTGRRIIVITGPNTGGKTVALKTLGLIGLMVRFGLPIPADPDSQVPWFPQVFADIGDEQSIEESLSTFSAHVKNLGFILRLVEKNALVLIDELGTGTDPREGGAIALAVLEALVEKNCFAFVTTHHGSVKAYAYEHGEVENASMIFDNETLSPTFRIQYGVPGESHAIDTAQRVGFPSEILQKAREFAKEEGSSLELLLERLAAEEQKLQLAMERTNMRDQELRSARDEVDRLKRDLEVREIKLKSNQLGEANQYLQEARKEMNRLIQEIKLSGKMLETKAIHTKSQEIGSEFKEAYEETVKDLRKKRQREMPVLSPGMKVRIDGSTQTGVLVKKIEPDKWLIHAGMLKLTVAEDRVEPSDGEKLKNRFFIPDTAQDQYITGTALDQRPNIKKAQFTMDLRGKRLHEAISELELQIDNAQVQGLYFFTIIHGKGTGALQKGIHEYLRSLSSVQSYSFARPEDGGTGKTLVYLKEE